MGKPIQLLHLPAGVFCLFSMGLILLQYAINLRISHKAELLLSSAAVACNLDLLNCFVYSLVLIDEKA